MKPGAPTGAILLITAALESAVAATVFDLGGVSFRHQGAVRNVIASGRIIAWPFVKQERYIYDLQRVRSDWLLTFRQKFSLAAVYDHQAETGSYLSSFEYRAFARAEPVELLNLDSRVCSRGEFRWRHRLYRAYAEYDSFPLRFSAGRQQISWGAGYFWNPTDLFNPVSFALVEMEERHGVDAALLEVAIGALSQVQAVWAWGKKSDQARGALRFRTNLADYDFSLMAGKYFAAEVIGADFSGQIGGAGLRGEWLHNFSDRGADYDQLVLGWDYRFSNRWIVTGEYLFNSGELSARELLAAAARSRAGGVLTTSSHLAGLYADCQIHPLVHLTGYGSIDLEHGGAFLGPRVSWSVTQNTGLEAGALLSTGGGEFELFENTYYCGLSWYF